MGVLQPNGLPVGQFHVCHPRWLANVASAFPGPGFTEYGVHTQYGTKNGVVSSHNNKFGGDFDFHSRTTTTLPPLLPLLRPYYYFIPSPEREKGKKFFFFQTDNICSKSYLCLLHSLLALLRKDKSSLSTLSPQSQLNSSEDISCFPFTTSLFQQRHPPFYSFPQLLSIFYFRIQKFSVLLRPTAE